MVLFLESFLIKVLKSSTCFLAQKGEWNLLPQKLLLQPVSLTCRLLKNLLLLLLKMGHKAN